MTLRSPLLALLLVACTPSYWRCPEPVVARAPAAHALSATGLYSDLASEQLAEGVVPYRPQFELWSDGASKRRWVWLPPGSQIDVRDVDAWQFPTGTKFWKEFSRDGTRVETRLLEKRGPSEDDWLAVAYVWSAAGDDAFAAPEGVRDARGTPHDVPPARDCMGCHGGAKGRVLGFSAIQLDHRVSSDAWSLQRLAAEGRLAGPLPELAPIPGDLQTQQVLGYLHANCASCHNQARPAEADGLRCWNPRRDLDLSLRVGELGSAQQTAVYRTAIGSLVEPGKPESSALYKRSRGDLHFFQTRMPPLASERIDPSLLPLLAAWIRALPPAGQDAKAQR